jgi:hypothetical protein
VCSKRSVLEIVVHVRRKVCMVCQEAADSVKHEIEAKGNSQNGVCDHGIGVPARR